MPVVFDANLTATPTHDNAAASTIVAVTDSAAQSESRVFLFVSFFSATTVISSISGGGLAWGTDLFFRTGNDSIAICSAVATDGLALSTTITVNLSLSTGGRALAAFSATGLEAGSVGTSTSAAGSGTTWTSGAVVTTFANVLLVGMGMQDGSAGVTCAPDADYTEVHDWNDTSAASAWQSVYRITTSAAAYTAGGTFSGGSGASVGGMVAYKGGVAPPTAGVLTPGLYPESVA